MDSLYFSLSFTVGLHPIKIPSLSISQQLLLLFNPKPLLVLSGLKLTSMKLCTSMNITSQSLTVTISL